jgi:carboxyl-terminal processing protease
VEESKPAQIEKTNKANKKDRKVALYTIFGLLAAASIFTSGWFFGAGKISFRSTSIVPVLDNRVAPRDGINELYSQLIDNFDGEISDEAILDGQKSGLVAAADDPFTEYLNEEETEEFNNGLNGSFEGIGAELSREGNFVVIVAPIKGTPADRAGIQPGDIIIEIDGEDATDISVSEAVNRIRGPKGEEVVLTVIRDGQEVVVPIVRDTIIIESVEWELQGSTGVITISRFGDDTVALARQAAQELKDQGATNIVLDLRGNPGGLLDASVDVSSIWLPKGSTVLEEKRNGAVIQTFKTSDQPILAGVPTAVLINGGSASASEIVAGALHDNGAATLVGEQTFGKGSVQRVIPLSAGGSLKVTIARWFTPEGKNIDKEGIAPDQEVELTVEDREADRDPQLDAAKELLNQ